MIHVENPLFDYILVVDLPILPKGTKLCLSSGFYFNENETVFIKSTNYTGGIIKKIKPKDGKC